MPGDPASRYGFYTDRGETETRTDLHADRLSCHRFLSNQLRLLLNVAAYIPIFSLREELRKTTLASARVDTLSLRLLKIAVKVVVSTRRIWFHLASSHPGQPIWNFLGHGVWLPPDSSPLSFHLL